MKKNNYSLGAALLALLIFATCAPSQKSEEVSETTEVQEVEPEITYSTKDAKSIIKAVEMASGGWDKLWEQKDVEFNYSYVYPQSGQEDLSMERYVFDTEESWAKYTKHQINVLPEMDGEVIQYYDGQEAKVMYDTTLMDDPEVVAGAQFLRKANYFWFVMMYKLDNPGAQYEYLGSEEVESVNYDKVKVSYDAEVTGKEQNDTYVLYVNPETKMVDQFLFSLPVLGVTEPAIIMKLTYEDVNGFKLATNRRIFMPSENGYSEEPNLVQTMTNIRFNNGFTQESFAL